MAKRYSRTAFSPSTTVLATWRSKFTCSPSSAQQVVVQRRRRRVRVEFFVAQVVATADTFVSQDYDVPLGLSLTPASCVSDYDLLSPYQRPASDVDGSISSNRSSVTSAGSLSSGCASVRSVHLPSFSASRSTTAAGAPRMNGFGPQLSDQSAARRCVSEATSDGSADSASR